MSEFRSVADVEAAFRAVSATFARSAKAMAEIGEAARRLNRDFMRVSRRPAQIHKGGRPRA